MPITCPAHLRSPPTDLPTLSPAYRLPRPHQSHRPPANPPPRAPGGVPAAPPFPWPRSRSRWPPQAGLGGEEGPHQHHQDQSWVEDLPAARGAPPRPPGTCFPAFVLLRCGSLSTPRPPVHARKGRGNDVTHVRGGSRPGQDVAHRVGPWT